MIEHNLLPHKMFYSNATRTYETLNELQEGMGRRLDALACPELYLASAGDLLHFINQMDDGLPSAMLLGHNPGLHMISATLCGKGQDDKIQQLEEKFPTATLAILRFNSERWRDIRPGEGELLAYIRPEQLEIAD